MVALHFNELVDWEPCVLQLRFADPARNDSADLRKACLEWFDQKQSLQICPCQLKFLHLMDMEPGTIKLYCQWLCRLCIPAFTQFLGKGFPSLSDIEIGLSVQELRKPTSSEFIQIDAQPVEFENGEFVAIEAFQISRHPVSVKEYHEFANATGYQTAPERAKKLNCVYWENATIVGFSKKVRNQAPARCLSLFDCFEYCRWAGVRLPTEAEWIAAAIPDKNIYRKESFPAMHLRVGTDPRYLEGLSTEWTQSFAANGQAIVRRGPKFARMENWREKESQHRFFVDPTQYDEMTGFRVVKFGATRMG